jgi:hypothetical protein
MTVTERQEHVRTGQTLEALTRCGGDPNSDGGGNLAFSVSRQGAPSNRWNARGRADRAIRGATYAVPAR